MIEWTYAKSGLSAGFSSPRTGRRYEYSLHHVVARLLGRAAALSVSNHYRAWAAEPHVTLDHTGYFEADELRRKVESRGLSVSSLCPENIVYPWQYAARKPLHAQRSLAYFKHGIELAEVLGAPYMSINSGWGDWDEDREEAWKRSAEHLSILADYAGEHGVTLCMESLRPQESNLVTTLADAARMLDQVASPHLTPMVDTTAMGVAGETLDDWFRAFGDGSIKNMHFCIDGDPYGHLVWGDGKHNGMSLSCRSTPTASRGTLARKSPGLAGISTTAAADERNMRAFEKYFVD